MPLTEMEPKPQKVYAPQDRDEESESEDDTLMNGKAGLLEKESVDNDLEAQITREKTNATATEYQTPLSLKYLYLSLYFALNLTLTIYNKYVLGKVCRPRFSLPRLHADLVSVVCIPVAAHNHPYRHHGAGLFHVSTSGLFQDD